MGTTALTSRCSHGNALFRALKPKPPNPKLPTSFQLSTTHINKGAGRSSSRCARAYDALPLDAGDTLLQLTKPVEETYAAIGTN